MIANIRRLRQRLVALGGWAFTHVPWLGQLWARSTHGIAVQHEVPWSPLHTPLRDCRIALITTGGVHRRDQMPFNMDDLHGDATYRRIPPDTSTDQLTITHNYYDHTDADRDVNILLPLDRVTELVEQGMVASLGQCYSFMGHITGEHITTLVERTAPEVAQLLKHDKIDAVLLTPA